MKITKLGHCALVLEHKGVKILTDPGSFTAEAQEKVTGLHVILITHEHQDHFHTDSIKVLVEKNPDAIIITNAGVGKQLTELGIPFTTVGDGETTEVQGITFEGFGKNHAPIYGTMGLVENTGYFLDNIFYFPGDSFYNPEKPIDILALPVAGPWMKMSEAIDFAKLVKARVAFGVHDGMIEPFFRGFVGNALKMFASDTEYVSLKDGESRDF